MGSNIKGKSTEDKKIIILEDLDFLWSEETIEKVKNMWDMHIGLKGISKVVNREEDEVFLLLLHLARKKEIKKRDSYIWGVFNGEKSI